MKMSKRFGQKPLDFYLVFVEVEVVVLLSSPGI